MWLETGAVVGGCFFILFFVKVFERADLPVAVSFGNRILVLSGRDALFLH